MSNYLTCWIDAAVALFSQALSGEPQLVESPAACFSVGSFGFTAYITGEWAGSFTVVLDRGLLDAPLMGEGVDQKKAWEELLREVAEAAAGDLLARTGSKCRLESFVELPDGGAFENGRAFLLKSSERNWTLLVDDNLVAVSDRKEPAVAASRLRSRSEPGLDLLLDVELEATLRFGCRELPLGEVLDLGPGDVVQLDRTVHDPVDLVVGDKIVARGEVVLVNGNFGLRVIEVASPRKRLESIRCLF
jgi:flagellar motor switch protein FliN